MILKIGTRIKECREGDEIERFDRKGVQNADERFSPLPAQSVSWFKTRSGNSSM